MNGPTMEPQTVKETHQLSDARARTTGMQVENRGKSRTFRLTPTPIRCSVWWVRSPVSGKHKTEVKQFWQQCCESDSHTAAHSRPHTGQWASEFDQNDEQLNFLFCFVWFIAKNR